MISAVEKKAWGALVLVLVIILLAGRYIYNTQFEYDLELAKQKSMANIGMFSVLVEESLQKKDYQLARETVMSWGGNSQEIDEIILSTKNGFELAHYQNPESSTHQIHNTVEIPYAYNGLATLTLHTSIDSIYKSKRDLLKQFLFGYVVIGTILLYLVLTNLRIQKQTRELAIENTMRMEAERKLKEHRDHLEDMVHERTKELERIRDEALSATKAKTEFLASVSHELRTPLNSIIGFTSIVRDGQAGDINEEQKKQLNMAHKSAQHLLGLINDILDLSKIEAGQLSLSEELFSLPLLVDEITDMMKPLIDSKGLSLIVDIQTVPELLFTDRGKLKQILVNLLGNAVKFTSEGAITLRCETCDNTLDISIIDTGIGIAAGDQEKIFSAFSQLDGGDNRIHGGTGLGLVICIEFLSMMDGSLSVDSEPGAGSTFTIHLPLQNPKQRDKQQ